MPCRWGLESNCVLHFDFSYHFFILRWVSAEFLWHQLQSRYFDKLSTIGIHSVVCCRVYPDDYRDALHRSVILLSFAMFLLSPVIILWWVFNAGLFKRKLLKNNRLLLHRVSLCADFVNSGTRCCEVHFVTIDAVSSSLTWLCCETRLWNCKEDTAGKGSFCNGNGAKGSALSFALRTTTQRNLRTIKFRPIVCQTLLILKEKSRVKGDFQARFCGGLGLKCPCLSDLCVRLS